MSLLSTHPQTFDGFGPSVLVRQTRGYLRHSRIPPDRLTARKMLRQLCPTVPGVYGWLDTNGQLIYVGKSKSLRSRLLSYFAKTPSDPKMDRIRQQSYQLIWEPISDELLALIREQELIHRWRPPLNVQGQPNRLKPAFICLSHSPAPNAYLTRQKSPQVDIAFGPITGTERLRQAIETLNYEFELRDCPDKTKFEFNDQLNLFGNLSTAQCIRHELGTCPAPCAAGCSASDYKRRVDNLLAFMAGRDRTILSRLKSEMETAASKRAFERAACLRDNLDRLTWLDRRLSALRMAESTLNGALAIEARKGRIAWLLLHQGKLIESMPYHANHPKRAKAALDSLKKTSSHQADITTTRLDISLQLLIMSWFKKHPQYRRQIISFDEAIESCQQALKPQRHQRV